MIEISKGNQAQPAKTSRRRFVTLTGAGIGLALGAAPCSGDEHAETERILKRGDKIDIGGKGQEIVEKAYRLGFDYEKQNGG